MSKPFSNFLKSSGEDNLSDFIKSGYAYEDAGCFDKAAECYYEAARLGDAEAMHNLGVSYFIGDKYGSRDLNESEKWLELAAEMGHSLSMSMLGYINYFVFSPESLRKSYKWLWKAAVNGDIDAMLFLALNFFLSENYHLSDYVNESKGISMLERAAELGDARAMLLLAQYHMSDSGKWFRKYNRIKMSCK